MRKDQVDGILCKRIERSAFGNNIPKKRVIMFHMRLLPWTIRITEKHRGLFCACQIILKSKYIGEFPAVISKKDGKKLRKVKPRIGKCLFQGTDFGGSFGGALMEAFDIDSATPEELVQIAQDKGVDLQNYIIG